MVLKCVPHVQHDYFSALNQSHHCFLGSSLPLLSSLLPNELYVSSVTPSPERMTNFAERIHDEEKRQDLAAYHVQDICPSLESDTLENCHTS